MILEQYAYGVMICYLTACVIWAYLAAFNFKWRKKRFIGSVMICLMMVTIAYRNYMYFIEYQQRLSDDLMYSNFITAALALIGSYFIWTDRG